MRLTLSLVLITAITLYGASFLRAAESAPLGSSPEAGSRPAPDSAPRDARPESQARSICTGCDGPVVPFDPGGGADAGRALDTARPQRSGHTSPDR